MTQASQGTQRFKPRESRRGETVVISDRPEGTAGEYTGRTRPGPRGIGGTAKQQAEELNNAAMQRAMSQMSQQGQQYWQQYMEAKLREKRTDAIATLREEYNALSDADRQIVLQLHAAGN